MSYRTQPSNSSDYPSGLPYIIFNEAAERFSFYGMKAALAIFITQYLHLMGPQVDMPVSNSKANEYVHYFVMCVYLTPLLGAIISDVCWGKYKTIIVLSVVYCFGHAALAMVGISGPPALWLLAGLGLIAIGSGGIKPCVSAHLGDQFGKNNQHRLSIAYNYFYLSINFGAVISNLCIPWILKWYGPHWAFGIPGVLMALATMAFWFGRNRFIHVPAAGLGFLREMKSPLEFLSALKPCIIFLFIPFFWALFEQTGSSMVFQAVDMDRQLFGIEILPSQIQAANPFLILLLIPLFTFFIYPTVNKIIPLTPLRKIGAGLFLMVAAFSTVALVQAAIDSGKSPTILWQLFAYLLLTASEVMVSVVCIEFAYTQAPKAMKSIIMALFFLSVAMGNFITAQVNRFIQTPSPIASALDDFRKLPTPTDSISYAGFDRKLNTADDIIVHFNDDQISQLEVPSQQQLTLANTIISDWSQDNQSLPTTEQGNELIAGMLDSWSEPISYQRLNKLTYRIQSNGPDKLPTTQWDVGLIESVDFTTTDDTLSENKPSWLERRSRELNYIAPEQLGGKHLNFYAGGQDKLEGADYFWFFTGIMLATAILYVPVARLYPEKTILQK